MLLVLHPPQIVTIVPFKSKWALATNSCHSSFMVHLVGVASLWPYLSLHEMGVTKTEIYITLFV
jgi:hypothetical protein